MSIRLAHQTQKTAGIGNGMRTATIAAVSGSTVTLSVNGGLVSSGVGVIDWYTPVVGDVVAVFRQDSSWLVLGAIGTSLGPQPRAQDTGSVFANVVAAFSLTIPVTFNMTFAQPPVVTTNINSAAGNSRIWHSRAFGATTTGCTIWVASGDGSSISWSGNVEWVATATQ